MAKLVKSTRWRPANPGGGSSGVPVECEETGECGLAKRAYFYQEILAYRLAKAVNLNVPEVRLEKFDGKDVAFSISWGEMSFDIPKLKRDYPEEYVSPAMEAGRKQASGLLALHAWVGNVDDQKDDHVVVRPGIEAYVYELASVDFAAAFQPGRLAADIAVTGPPMLIDRTYCDKAILDLAVSAIEALTDEKITDIVHGIESGILSLDDKKRIVECLIARKGKLRSAFTAAGWLP
jgi:hypothetical protein